MTKKFIVTDPVGLHARPATLLVTEAGKYASKLTIEVDGKEADLKSVMGVMALAIAADQTFSISADGDDAEAAITAVAKVIVEHEIGKEN